MNFSSLDEAWNIQEHISPSHNKLQSCNNTQKLNKLHSSKSIETFKNNSNNNSKILNHNDIINHVVKCKYCRNKLTKKLCSSLNIIIQSIIQENKDVILLALILLFISLSVNLVMKI